MSKKENSDSQMKGNSMHLRIRVLGCGTSTGVPVIGCDCSVCQSSLRENKRRRSSILIQELNSKKNIVIDTGPDFRWQMLDANISVLDGVLYTHTHADHCHGFDDLRPFFFNGKKHAMGCYATKEHFNELCSRFPYAFSDTGYIGMVPTLSLVELKDSPVNVAGMEVEFLRLPHGSMESTAFRIGEFAYATDFEHFPDKAIEAWRGKITYMIASGLRFRDHPTHSTVNQTISLFNKLGVRNGVLTHMSHDVDYAKDSQTLPDHVVYAYDGLTFDVIRN